MGTIARMAAGDRFARPHCSGDGVRGRVSVCRASVRQADGGIRLREVLMGLWVESMSSCNHD